MSHEYAANIIASMVRDCARSPARILNAVPVEFANGFTHVSAETNSHLITITLEECPIIPYKEFLAFIDNVFGRLHGYRVSLRFIGTTELCKFANVHLADLYAHWQCRFDVRMEGGFVLEVFRLRHQKK
jgi:hypothetical protein